MTLCLLYCISLFTILTMSRREDGPFSKDDELSGTILDESKPTAILPVIAGYTKCYQP